VTLSLFLLAVGNVALLLAVRSLRKQRLKERYALLLGGVGVPFLALAAWPDAVGYAARMLGIEYQTVLLLAVTVFFLLMNFSLLSIVSQQERRITCLAQIVAMLSQRQKGAAARHEPAARLPLDESDKEVA
jgi:hypothetical protein